MFYPYNQYVYEDLRDLAYYMPQKESLIQYLANSLYLVDNLKGSSYFQLPSYSWLYTGLEFPGFSH